jgi:hypothetical protein
MANIADILLPSLPLPGRYIFYHQIIVALDIEDRRLAASADFIGENPAQLRELKASYDPMNLFRIDANIEPT